MATKEEELEKAVKEMKYLKPLSSKEYRRFLIEEFLAQKRESLYEKACNFAEKIFRIRMDPDAERNFQEAIKFCYLDIGPSGPVSLVSLLLLVLSPILVLLTILGIFKIETLVVSFIFLLLSCFYLYKYPFFRVRMIRAKASTEIVLTVLYMAVSLREIPNLENAVMFAAANLTGPLSRDLKRVLWKLETQQFTSVEPALDEFTDKWGKENEEFVNAIKLLKSSVQQPTDRALKLIDESIQVVLIGTTDRMNHYAQDLRMPVMVIYSLGIILPVITLILFPIMMIFLQQYMNISFLIIGYDILLPISLFWFINNNLKAKPPAVSQPDVSEDLDQITIGSSSYSVLIVAIPILLILGSLAAYMMLQYRIPFSMCSKWQACNPKTTFDEACKPANLKLDFNGCKAAMTDIFTPTVASSLMIWAVSLSIGASCLMMTRGRMGLRARIKKLESEFTEALFQLGHQIMSGHGVEHALNESKKNLKGLEMANFYDKILNNIKIMGATLENAIFNKEYGAVWEYPSEIIRSIMKIIVEASRKSLISASTSMLTISKYLKGMRDIEEKIRDILSETITSMKFLSMILSPLVAGITVAMAVVIINIMTNLSLQMTQITGTGIEIPTSATFLVGLWKGSSSSIGVDMFQLVLGIYVIETTILLAMFVNGLENGEDRMSELDLMGKMLILSTAIYTVTLLIIYSVFGGLLQNMLLGVG